MKTGSLQNKDALEQAGDDTHYIPDDSLAKKFLISNERCVSTDIAELEHVLLRDTSSIEVEDIEVSDETKKSIYNTLKQKHVFHNQLLVEGESPNRFISIFQKIKRWFSGREKMTVFSNLEWRMWELCDKQNRREVGAIWSDCCSYADTLLRHNDTSRQILLTEIIISALLFFPSLIIVSTHNYFLNFFPGHVGPWVDYQNNWQGIILGVSFFAMMCSVAPWIFLAISWLVGVNNLHKVRKFHIFYLCCLALSFVVFIVSLVMFMAYIMLSDAYLVG